MGKPRSSRTWNYFIQLDDNTACCKICNKVTSCKTTISNLKRHVTRRHPANWASSNYDTQVDNETEPMVEKKNESAAPNTSRRRSVLWNFFVSKDDYVSVCNVCKRQIRYKGSTANLKRHMERKHPNVFSQIFGEGNQTGTSINIEEQKFSIPNITMNDCGQNGILISTTSSTPKQTKVYHVPKMINNDTNVKINNSLLKLFTHDYQPINMIEDIGFQEFVTALNPMYNLPKVEEIRDKLLPALYQQANQNAQETIKDARLITVTMDCWASMNSENFMAVIAYFLTDEYEMKSVLLDCVALERDCNSAYLVSQLKRITEEWKVDDKILLVISDLATSEDLKVVVKEELNCEYFNCYVNTLNLIVLNGLRSLDSLIIKVRNVVANFLCDINACAMLNDIQKEMGKEPKKLLQDEEGCWISLFYMIRRILALEETLTHFENCILSDLTEEDRQTLRDIKRVLEPMESLVKIMTEQKYVTISSIIILTKGLENVYREMQKHDFVVVAKNLSAELLNGIRLHLGDLEENEVLITTTFLDPRFKNVGFSNEAVASKAQKLVEELVCNKINLISLFSSRQEIEIEIHKDDEDSLVNGDEQFSVWGHFEEKAAAIQTVTTNSTRAVEEVNRYLADGLQDRRGDPLVWWKQHSCKYPFLKEVVIERLGTTATSVPCENIFSERGKIITERRCRLNSDVVRSLVFINGNK